MLPSEVNMSLLKPGELLELCFLSVVPDIGKVHSLIHDGGDLICHSVLSSILSALPGVNVVFL